MTVDSQCDNTEHIPCMRTFRLLYVDILKYLTVARQLPCMRKNHRGVLMSPK